MAIGAALMAFWIFDSPPFVPAPFGDSPPWAWANPTASAVRPAASARETTMMRFMVILLRPGDARIPWPTVGTGAEDLVVRHDRATVRKTTTQGPGPRVP